MAIQFAFTNPITGAVSPMAHLVVDDPIIRGDVAHVVLRAKIYASKADYDAGKQHIALIEREYGEAEYTELRAVTMPVCEGWVIRDSAPEGVPVPDLVQAMPQLFGAHVVDD